jgi:hypothetical protein
MDDLIAFLRAQLDEDERVAREAGQDRPDWKFDHAFDGHYPYSRELGISAGTTQAPGYVDPPQAEHIARWDPARVLAEVEAKRRILDDYEREDLTLSPEHWSTLEDVIRALAQPYAGRPGWREEWRA